MYEVPLTTVDGPFRSLQFGTGTVVGVGVGVGVRAGVGVGSDQLPQLHLPLPD